MSCSGAANNYANLRLQLSHTGGNSKGDALYCTQQVLDALNAYQQSCPSVASMSNNFSDARGLAKYCLKNGISLNYSSADAHPLSDSVMGVSKAAFAVIVAAAVLVLVGCVAGLFLIVRSKRVFRLQESNAVQRSRMRVETPASAIKMSGVKRGKTGPY
ncbi:hypothetical protein BC830DRAFT_1100100 [Chytriomyces sp. MP71]|nr:hypothetical protein BC830DRAFT_1100100 [Chytriomyces sp. MP71]